MKTIRFVVAMSILATPLMFLGCGPSEAEKAAMYLAVKAEYDTEKKGHDEAQKVLDDYMEWVRPGDKEREKKIVEYTEIMKESKAKVDKIHKKLVELSPSNQ